MPELRLIPLSESLSHDQLAELRRQLKQIGVDRFDESDDAADLDDTLNEDQLTDFLDRLEAHDIAADIYLPVEFEGRVTVGEQVVGSAYTLIEALEEIREELDIDEEAADEDEEEVDLEVIEEQLTFAWRAFTQSANASIERKVPLHVIP